MGNFKEFAKELDLFKINDNLIIIGISEHRFFDGFTVRTNSSEKVYYLYSRKEPIAIFQLKSQGLGKGVEIGFIQGMKGVRPPDCWIETMLTPIVYLGLKYFPELKNNAISLDMTTFNKYASKNSKEDLKNNPLLKSEMGIYGKARDLFFDKSGKLNFNKERVKGLVTRLQNEAKLKLHFQKQLRRKPIAKLRDLFKGVKRKIFYK